jgi:hypothetical protein
MEHMSLVVDVHDLAMRIEEAGFGAVQPEVASIVAQARRSHASPTLIAVAADRSEPEPARIRAVALLLAALPGLTGSRAGWSDADGGRQPRLSA